MRARALVWITLAGLGSAAGAHAGEDLATRTWSSVSSYYVARSRDAKDHSVEQELHRRYDPAIVMIEVLSSFGERTVGTGFFISPDGELITNFHVLRNYVNDAGAEIHFELSNGKKLTSFKVGRCKQESLDLCHLKLPLYPEKYFSTRGAPPPEGTAIYLIGNPAGHAYQLASGKYLGSVHIGTASEVEVSIPFIGGVSGSPIFTARGELIGAAYLNSQMKLNLVPKHLQNEPIRSLGIAVPEIRRYESGTQEFVSPKQYFGK